MVAKRMKQQEHKEKIKIKILLQVLETLEKFIFSRDAPPSDKIREEENILGYKEGRILTLPAANGVFYCN